MLSLESWNISGYLPHLFLVVENRQQRKEREQVVEKEKEDLKVACPCVKNLSKAVGVKPEPNLADELETSVSVEE